MNLTRNFSSAALAIASVLSLSNCANTSQANSNSSAAFTAPCGERYAVKSVEHGKASWYSIGTNAGTRTASGERLSNDAATAAHKTLPMGTRVRVTNVKNGKSEIVRIIDRGPYTRGRIIDLTIGSAERLGFRRSGVVPVKVEVLKHFDTKSG